MPRESKEFREIEKEPQPKKEVWIVDDMENVAQSLVCLWQDSKLDYIFNHFPTAKSLFEEINRRLEEIKGQPAKKIVDIIFMDGELKGDEGELRNGANVIKKIKEIKEIEQPIIAAFSVDFANNIEMMQTGANLALNKMDLEKTIEFLKDPEKLLSQKEKQGK